MLWLTLKDWVRITLGRDARSKPQDPRKLISVLKETLNYVQVSDDSVYARYGVNEITAQLKTATACLERGEAVRDIDLSLLFAPTGDIQETSIENGWADEFIVLSDRFDRAVGRPPSFDTNEMADPK